IIVSKGSLIDRVVGVGVKRSSFDVSVSSLFIRVRGYCSSVGCCVCPDTPLVANCQGSGGTGRGLVWHVGSTTSPLMVTEGCISGTIKGGQEMRLGDDWTDDGRERRLGRDWTDGGREIRLGHDWTDDGREMRLGRDWTDGDREMRLGRDWTDGG
ncbi:hypothetical protein B296_00056712, partial [Ensete ventricosum]